MSQNDWNVLLTFPVRETRKVLSVFLNVDQSRQVNLNRGFQTQFKGLMTPLGEGIRDVEELERFRAAADRLMIFLSTYEPRARGLALFFDETDQFMYHHELAVTVKEEARWDREFFLRPLAEATDEFERYGVALVDRANGRLMTVSLGEVEEVAREVTSRAAVRHIKTVGMDQLGSSSGVQRRADEQVRKNLRLLVRDLDEMHKAGRIDHVILAGASEPVSDLRALLPKRLASLVIGSVSLKADATVREVLAEVSPVIAQQERDGEEEIVRDVTNSAAKGRKAVIGLDKTLKHLSQHRVWQLIYCANFSTPGLECPQCGALFASPAPQCFYCTAPLDRVPDVIERAIQRGVRDGAKIERVSGGAAAILKESGGIGAFLKTRTRSATG